jgi:aspartyl-tRNA(Asn)/glutamyl-tRNA(Gln) amidotransferase subunit B
MAEWEAVIGLEIHVQLKTRTKMFCGCQPGFGGEPNTRTCPVCLALPGALPVPNENAVAWTIKLGHALNCRIAEHAIFHRKNYFYPDNPKGYQISQYDEPLCIDGFFVVPGPEGDSEIGIVRAHLEEDAAKTIHLGGATGRIVGAAHSDVDFNRGGTPLVEIVTKPDLRSADEAKRFLQLLRQTIVELGVSDAEMEKGTLRADANVSVRELGESGYRTRTELKNMNSFNHIARGIEAELRRQIDVWESRGKVVQETLDYEVKSDTVTARRRKEEADDYRYFPEPDLVPVVPTDQMLAEARDSLPELPAARRERYLTELGLSEEAATTLAFQAELGEYFEQAVAAADGTPAKAIANWVTGELVAALRQAGAEGDLAASKATPEAVASLAGLVEAKTISHGAGKQVLAKLVEAGGDPAEIVEQEGLAQISDSSELEGIVDRAIEAEPQAAEQVRQGNDKAIGRIVGAVMKESKGRADGGTVTKLIKERL